MPLAHDNGRTGTPLADDRHEDIRLGGGAASLGGEPEAFRSTPERVSTLRFYLSVIGRRRLPMLIAFLVPVVVAVALTVTAKKQYQGSALVVINRQSLSDQLTGTPDPTASSSDFVNIITTDADAARSIQVANRVAQAVPDGPSQRSGDPRSGNDHPQAGRRHRRVCGPRRRPESGPAALDRIRPGSSSPTSRRGRRVRSPPSSRTSTLVSPARGRRATGHW